MDDYLRRLRYLDIDDLIILAGLADGESQISLAAKLNMTSPAVTQRMTKMRHAFSDPLTVRANNTTTLTEVGKWVAMTAKGALDVLRNTTAH